MKNRLTELTVALLFTILMLIFLFRIDSVLTSIQRAADATEKAAIQTDDTMRSAKERFIE